MPRRSTSPASTDTPEDPAGGGPDAPGVPEAGGVRSGQRVTVNLSARAASALEEVSRLTGDSKTEVINKSLQAYALVQAAQDVGGGAWLQDRADTDPVRVRFY